MSSFLVLVFEVLVPYLFDVIRHSPYLEEEDDLQYSDRCYTDYTTRDIVTYKRDYALEQVKFCEQALSEFDKEGKK